MSLKKYQVFFVNMHDDDLGDYRAIFALAEDKQPVSVQKSDDPPIATYDLSDEDHAAMEATPGVTLLEDE